MKSATASDYRNFAKHVLDRRGRRNPPPPRLLAAAATAVLLMLLAPAAPGFAADAPTLAPVNVPSERRQLIGLQFAAVEEKVLGEQLDVTASIEPDERARPTSRPASPAGSRRFTPNQTYQYVRRGEPLFSIYSPELVSTQEEYLLALKAGLSMANSSVKGVAAKAASLVDAAAQRLRLWGISERQIERLARDRKVRHALEIEAPMSGYLIERNALPNLYVQPETRLYTIADLSSVWAYLAVFQDEAGKVRPGNAAALKVDAYPGETFNGRVDFIWPQIDPATRTIRVRCDFGNRAGKLMPGMFARVALSLPMGRRLAIPDGAVLRNGTHNVAFVDRGDGYLTPREDRSRSARRERFHRDERASRGRANRQLGQFPDRFGKPTAGRTRQRSYRPRRRRRASLRSRPRRAGRRSR